MGKQILSCIEDRLQIVSARPVQTMSNMSETVTVSTEPTKPAAAAPAAGQSNPQHHRPAQEAAAQNGKLLFSSQAVVRKRLSTPLPLPQHKRNMVDGIMKRLSIGAAADTPTDGVFATKVFRKRANSSGQGHDLGAKIQVIDNQEAVPGALRTPVVRGSLSSSVFKSDACDTALLKYNKSRSATPSPSPGPLSIDVKTESDASSSSASSPSSSAHSTPRKSYCSDLPRPNVRTPPLDDLFRKPRTVAEKRLFLLQSPVEYKVLDFENTVYHLIRKLDRLHHDDVFRTQVELLMYGTVPMNRNIWKAVLWLNSVCNSYRQWTLDCDEQTVRLVGSLGTCSLDEGHVSSKVDLTRATRLPRSKKRILPEETKPLKKLKNEDMILSQLDQLANDRLDESFTSASSITSPKTLIEKKRTATLASLKPGPLSTKLRRIHTTEDDSQLGPLEPYDLPPKTFIAEPQLNRPLAHHVSSYMKRVVPKKMDQDWLQYSLSVLQSSPPAEETTAPEGSDQKFYFTVPYKNDQKRILVRRKLTSTSKRRVLGYEDFARNEGYEYTFPAVARTSLEAEGASLAEPKVFEEVAGILSQMIDSVAIGLAENSFIKNDPDLVYQADQPVKKLRKNEVPTDVPTGLSKKKRNALCQELRKLNVTIIETANLPRNGDCTKEECKRGCVCESLSRLDGLITHCTKTECMFGCSCTPEELANEEQEHLERIREDKNKCLAPNEKEFKSTIVLTNSNTILLCNSNDRKRNRTAPKRYYDYLGTASDDEDSLLDASSSGKGNKEGDFKVYFERKRSPWHPTLEAMRHCHVALPALPMLDVLEPWCMVHEMYRCFCGNQRVTGSPFRIQANPDGTIRSSIKESVLANCTMNRRRPAVAKDEFQDSLERIPRHSAVDEDGCARCIPVDFTNQFIKNRLNSELVNTKARLAAKKSKQERLDGLIQNCLMATYDPQPLIPPVRQRRSSTVREERVRVKQEQFMEHAQNELGLQISNVFSLGQSTQSADPASSVNTESNSEQNNLLSELKKNLLLKLDMILQSCSKALLERPQLRKVNFIRFRNFKSLMEQLVVFEVWDEDGTPQCMVLGRDLKSLQGNFPNKRLVNAHSADHQFYLSKFISDESGKLQSNNIYLVIEGSGRNFWFVRGCQYIKEIQDKIRIKSEHTNQLRVYASRLNQSTSNIVCRTLPNLGLMALNLRVPVVPGCRYLWLKMQPDFSDMGHPRWKGLLSFKHITQAMNLAKAQNKTVQVLRGTALLRPNLYATADQHVIAGPFDKEEECHLSLYQRVDNRVYLREVYEQMMKIERQKQTIGVWLTSEQLQRRRHSEKSAGVLADAAPVSARATVLPELEIGRATIKQERIDSPTPEVSLTALNPGPSRCPRRMSLAEQRKSLEADKPPDLDANMSIIALNKLLADPDLKTFRVGNTIVQRENKSAELPDDAQNRQSSNDATEVGEKGASEEPGDDNEDDDVVLVSNGSPCIIDLDEWERVQQELEADESQNSSGESPSTNEAHATSDPVEEEASEEVIEEAPIDEIIEEGSPSRQFDENIPASGFYISNIPNLGRIPAKVLGGVVTLPLPYRKMPIKIAVNAIDRYLMKYITNSVYKILPSTLKVKWNFVQSYFPTDDMVFKLDPTKHVATTILTEWGLIDVTDGCKTPKDIPDPQVYFRYIKAHLTMEVFGQLKYISIEDLIQETLSTIKKERYAVLKLNREKGTEKLRNEELKRRLSQLRKGPGPSPDAV